MLKLVKASPPSRPAVRQASSALLKLHGPGGRKDILRGVTYCVKVWDWKKSDARAFTEFCVKHYVPPGKQRRALLGRLDEIAGLVSGSFNAIAKTTRLGMDLADMPITPAEELFAAFAPGAHLTEDLRASRLAALAQLNFGTDDLTPPRTREGWTERRLANLGRTVIPAGLEAEVSRVSTAVDQFVTTFNIHLDKIEYPDPGVAFPKDTVRISHWGLRDYMTSLNGQPGALPKQRAIRDVMRRVVDGEIPRDILNNPKARWRQADGTVSENGARRKATPTGALRWEHFKRVWDVQRRIDPYRRHGNLIEDKFKLERELAEERVTGILEAILAAPVAKRIARYVEARLERPIEAHDIYFKSFQSGPKKEPLAFALGKRYPSAAALTAAIPDILVRLGFERKRARWIGSKIRVDNSRSAGHAWPPGLRHDLQLLRVRVGPQGLNEEGFSTYMHELGHCVEGVLTSYEMDHRALWSVPNTAISEGFAFTFQAQADFLLGRKRQPDPDVNILQNFWEAYEISGPALTEIRFFHWLYEHPQAGAAEMQRAIRKIGDEVWARYYAPVLGPEGYGLMSVYSHILWCSFYLADYTLGYVIAYQVRKYLVRRNLARETQRICALGNIYPDVWMQAAVGAPIGVEPLLEDAEAACGRITPQPNALPFTLQRTRQRGV